MVSTGFQHLQMDTNELLSVFNLKFVYSARFLDEGFDLLCFARVMLVPAVHLWVLQWVMV